MKLQDVTNIKLGLAFKKAIVESTEGSACYLIQAKDIVLEEAINFDQLSSVIPETNPSQHFLEKDDILLRMRGPIFSSAVIDTSLDLPLITTNQIAVIRCQKNIINPYYLHWYLNSKIGQSHLNRYSEGSNISKINLKIISEIEINLPNIEHQLEISKIQRNWSTQKSIYKKLIEINNQFYSELCKKINTGENDE